MFAGDPHLPLHFALRLRNDGWAPDGFELFHDRVQTAEYLRRVLPFRAASLRIGNTSFSLSNGEVHQCHS